MFPAIVGVRRLASRRRRVAITGVGLVTPLGRTKDEFVQALRTGTSGVRPVTRFDTSDLPCHVAGEVQDFDPSPHVDRRQAKRMGRATQFAVVASADALEDAGIDLTQVDRERAGVVIGSAVPGLEVGEEEHRKHLQERTHRVSPYLSVILFGGAISSEVSIRFGLKGSSFTLSTGCAASNDALGYAFRHIRAGDADLMLAGGAESPLTEMIYRSFCSIGAMSSREADPSEASCPFDRRRDGFVMAEGAAMFVLEDYRRARRRGATIYAEILGYAATADAHHMVQPDPEGAGNSRALLLALEAARAKPRDVRYINAHGSSTPLNDVTETKVIRRVFGRAAESIPVSSTKSMIGHPIGAAGAMELAATILCAREGFVHPTTNYRESDPECDLDYVPNTPRRVWADLCVSNSLGFGGKNACVVFAPA